MNILETISLSLTSILRNRLRSFLTILGIVIGVFSVVVLVALVSGLQRFITDQISGFGSNLIFVIPGQIGGGQGPGGVQVNRLQFNDVRDIEKALGDGSQVTAVIEKVATSKAGNKNNKNMGVTGADANYPKIVTAIKTTQGRFFNNSEGLSGRRVAVVGPTVVKNLLGNKNPIGQTITIGNARYEIIGVLEERGAVFGQDQDNSAIVPLQAMRKQFGITQPNGIYISVPSPEDMKAATEKIKDILKKKYSEEDFTVSTQEQALQTISQITGVLTAALGGIAAISLLVGGIGVMNIMLVSVTERTREIGLRKALGARPKDIRNQFLIEAITLSGLGGIIGILLGIGVSLIIGQFFTTSVPLWSIALSFGFSMAVGVIFGVTPAIRAAKLNPIQALRYE